MNLDNLEKVVREALKGKSAHAAGDAMLRSREITPIEHKALVLTSFRTMGNLKLDGGAGAGTVSFVQPNIMWL